MYVHTQTQCILLLTAFTTADDGVSIDIDVGDGDVELTVDLPNYNPCEEYECPGGEVCQVVVHPTLLQLPVAHCVENESREEGPCHEYTVGTNVMNCRTEDQWRAVGGKQCSLRGNAPSILTHTQVQHACHNYQPGDQTKFLSATFTCCSVGYKPSTPPPTSPSSHPHTSSSSHPHTSPPSHPHTPPSHPPEHHDTVTYQQLPSSDTQPDTGNRVGEGEEVEEEGNSTYYIPVVLGVVMMVALALVTLAVLLRYA